MPDAEALARAVAEHAVVLPPTGASAATGDPTGASAATGDPTEASAATGNPTGNAVAALDDVVGDARVVAVGEAIHFTVEAAAVQRRLVRHLAARHGFTVVAAEFGFAEGSGLDRWVRGEGSDDVLDLHPGVPGATTRATRDRWRWLREDNARAERPLRFVGIDTPCGGGSLRPVLAPLIAFLERADPEAVELAREAMAIAARIESLSQAGSAPLWAALPASERNALTAALSRLSLRADALRPHHLRHAGVAEVDLARRLLDIALATDQMVEAIHHLFRGEGRGSDAAVRERSMAESLLWHLDRIGDDERVVLIAHNLHLDRTGDLVLGQRLAAALGGDYRTIAVAHIAERAPTITMTDEDPHGFVVTEGPVAPAPPTGVEGALIAAGLADEVTLLPLAALRGDPRTEPDHLGAQGDHVPTDVVAAYDAVLTVPGATTAAHVSLY